ncbi:MAG: hypothetical protein WC775_05470 [Patescibacteria group bacterium]|jgi:hypothetical protein
MEEQAELNTPPSLDALRASLRESEAQRNSLRQAIREAEGKRKKDFFGDMKRALLSKKAIPMILLGILTGGIGTLVANPMYAGIGAEIARGVLAAGSSLLATLGINRAAAGSGAVPMSTMSGDLNVEGLLNPIAAPLKALGSLGPIGQVKTTFTTLP